MNNETNAYTHTDFDTHWCCLLKAELGIGTKKVTSAAKNYSIIFVYVHPTPTWEMLISSLFLYFYNDYNLFTCSIGFELLSLL